MLILTMETMEAVWPFYLLECLLSVLQVFLFSFTFYLKLQTDRTLDILTVSCIALYKWKQKYQLQKSFV